MIRIKKVLAKTVNSVETTKKGEKSKKVFVSDKISIPTIYIKPFSR